MRRTVPAPALLAAIVVLMVTAVAALAAEDPYRPQQWGLDRIGAPEVWTSTDGTGVVVAVLDTGVDLDHPDLRDRFVRDDGRIVGRDFVDDDEVPQDEEGHGTMVAGIAVATADNGEGIAGVAPGALLLPVRVLDDEGAGRFTDLDEGIRWAVDAGADVINLSLERADEPGTVGRSVGLLTAPASAVQYAWDNGVVVVAAAGNSGDDATDYPEDSPVLLVGASDREDRRAGFSDAGRRDAVLAPGVEIVSTWCEYRGGACNPERRYGIASGTSFAAPSVTGAVALLLAAGLDHREAVDRIRATARDLGDEGADGDTGVGLLDVAAAAGEPEPAPEPTPDPSLSPDSTQDDVSSATGSAPTSASPAPTEADELDQPAEETDPSPAPPAPAPTSSRSAAPAPGQDPSPVAAPAPVSSSDRAAWLGLGVVLLFVAAGSVGVCVYRHGALGFAGAAAWGRPRGEVKSRR